MVSAAASCSRSHAAIRGARVSSSVGRQGDRDQRGFVGRDRDRRGCAVEGRAHHGREVGGLEPARARLVALEVEHVVRAGGEAAPDLGELAQRHQRVAGGIAPCEPGVGCAQGRAPARVVVGTRTCAAWVRPSRPRAVAAVAVGAVRRIRRGAIARRGDRGVAARDDQHRVDRGVGEPPLGRRDDEGLHRGDVLDRAPQRGSTIGVKQRGRHDERELAARCEQAQCAEQARRRDIGVARELVDEDGVELGPVGRDHRGTRALDRRIDPAGADPRRVADDEVERAEAGGEGRRERVVDEDGRLGEAVARLRGGGGIDLDAGERGRARGARGGEERAIATGRIDHARGRRERGEGGEGEVGDRRGREPLTEGATIGDDHQASRRRIRRAAIPPHTRASTVRPIAPLVAEPRPRSPQIREGADLVGDAELLQRGGQHAERQVDDRK